MARPTPFASAYRADAISPAQVLAFHRAVFGDARMEDDGDQPEAPPVDGAGGEQGGESPHGFPEKTPIADMTAEQQAAYWKHQARKHEATAKARGDYDAVKTERDALKQSTLTESEKAVEAARVDERGKVEAEVRGAYTARLVTAEVKAALAATKFPADKIAGQVEFIDPSKFLTGDGEVDADKVKQYAAGLAPAGGQWPDMGGGKRGESAPSKGVDAGRDLYVDRHKTNK